MISLVEFLQSKFFFLLVMAAAAVGWVAIMKYINWSIGVQFKRDVWPILKTCPIAAAAYWSMRLAVAAAVICCAIIASAKY